MLASRSRATRWLVESRYLTSGNFTALCKLRCAAEKSLISTSGLAVKEAMPPSPRHPVFAAGLVQPGDEKAERGP